MSALATYVVLLAIVTLLQIVLLGLELANPRMELLDLDLDVVRQKIGHVDRAVDASEIITLNHGNILGEDAYGSYLSLSDLFSGRSLPAAASLGDYAKLTAVLLVDGEVGTSSRLDTTEEAAGHGLLASSLFILTTLLLCKDTRLAFLLGL